MTQQQGANNTFRLPALSDAQVVRMFADLVALNGDQSKQFQIHMSNVSLGAYRTAEQFFEGNPDHDWEGSRIISNGHVSPFDPLNVSFDRSASTFGPAGHSREPSTWQSEVWITWNGPAPDRTRFVQVVEIIERRRASAYLAPPMSDAPSSFVEIYAHQLAQLSELQLQIVRGAEEARIQREKELEERRAQLEAEGADLRRTLEAEASSDRDRLKQLELELTRRAADLDDRGHMHARRDLRAKITDDIKQRLQRPGVGYGARMQRFGILGGGIVLALVFAVFGFFSVTELDGLIGKGQAGSNLLTYMLLGRVALSVATVAGLGFYLLSWARTLHDDSLRADRDLERYRYDLDRASWAIETIMEANAAAAEGEDAVPAEWIRGATHGLFTRTENRDEHNPAVEALASMLNFAAEAEIGPSGPRFKFTKQGARQMGKQAARELRD